MAGRYDMLKKNQQRLKDKRRAKKLAEARKKKTESKPERNGFGERTPLSGGAGGHTTSKPGGTPKPTPQAPKPQAPKPKPQPPKPQATTPSNPPPRNRPGGSGTHGRPMPSNPQFGMQAPKRENYKTRAAYMAALERYTKLKNRAKRTAAGSRSSGKPKIDGKDFG